MKKGIVILGGIVVVVAGGLYGVMKDIPTMKEAKVEHIEVSALKDGTYDGEFKFKRWHSNVEVTVKDGVIADAKLLSDPLPPEKAINVFDEIVEEQKNDVDAVSGATATSKAYLKAVENALKENEAVE